jgi:hypothetical protein
MPANTKDHIIPICYLRSNRPHKANGIGDTVDCCRECNLLLNTQALFSIPERAHAVSIALERRYRKELNAPYWSDEEIDELGDTLRQQVKARQFIRSEVVERIRQAICVASGLQDAALPIHSIVVCQT